MVSSMSAGMLPCSSLWLHTQQNTFHLAGALPIHWLNSFSYVGGLLSGICFTLQIHLSFSRTRSSLLLNGKAGDSSFRTYASLEEWTVKGTRNSSTPSHRGLVVTPLIGSHLWELLEPSITYHLFSGGTAALVCCHWSPGIHTEVRLNWGSTLRYFSSVISAHTGLWLLHTSWDACAVTEVPTSHLNLWAVPKSFDWIFALAHMEVLLPLVDSKSVTSVFFRPFSCSISVQRRTPPPPATMGSWPFSLWVATLGGLMRLDFP